jgi:hypothetical protein
MRKAKDWVPAFAGTNERAMDSLVRVERHCNIAFDSCSTRGELSPSSIALTRQLA